ncbi:MAG: MFS transporter [Pseudomonadota bacterium]
MNADTRDTTQDGRGGYPPRRARISWMLFDWAQQPFFTLITTFIFAPYFAAQVAPDPATGQALWGYAVALSAFAIAIFAPVLGAVADRTGALKGWTAGFSVLLIIGATLLWFAVPGGGGVWIALTAFVIATIGAEFAVVFVNALMPRLVPADRLGRLSGTGWAVGYAGGLVALFATLAFLAADPDTGKTLIGATPPFGLDPTLFEGERLTGPLSALWFVVFAIPFFLFTPDPPRTTIAFMPAARAGIAELAETFREARANGTILRFLIARMAYMDGLVALTTFGAIYAASLLSWGTIEIGIFAIVIVIAATAGAALGGMLDDRFGAKSTIVWSLVILLISGIMLVSVTPVSIFFVVPVAPPGDAMFSGAAEWVYLAAGALVGVANGPVNASSRSLLARLAPAEDLGKFFGLYALSGKLTAFAGPLTVGLVISASGSQRLGMSVILVFFLVGLAILMTVRAPR